MDNVTHSLFGLTLAHTGLNRISPHATMTLLLGALFPDVDMVTFPLGSIHYLQFHRGVTHSLVGIFSGALVLASLVYFINRLFRKEKTFSPWWRLYLLSLVGIGSHVLLDFTNSYGVQLFYPFEDRWFAWDLVNIVDPWILGCLILGLGIPLLSRIINQEIGAAPSKNNWGAVAALILIFFYWGARDISHRVAIEELKQMKFDTGTPLKLSAFPDAFNPFLWRGIVETESAIHVVELGSPWPSTLSVTRPKRAYIKLVSPQIMEAAKTGPQGKIFFNFVRFPYGQMEELETGFRISCTDLRFASLGSRQKRFQFECELDRNLKMLNESFRF
jgi:inner membrane protein